MLDPLGEVLRSVRLTGGIFLDTRLSAPWCVRTHVRAEDCRPHLTAPTQIIAYHVVIDGTFSIGLEGGPTIQVHGGEIVLLPRNDVHVLASAPGLKPESARDLIQPALGGGELARICHGGGGDAVHFVCGFLATDQLYNPLIAGLPSLLRVDVRESAARDWVEASVQFAANELMEGRRAASGVVSRLSELLFVEAVRTYGDADVAGVKPGSRVRRVDGIPMERAVRDRLGRLSARGPADLDWGVRQVLSGGRGTTLRIDVNTKGEVRAEKIEGDHNVEIANPELKICTLTEDVRFFCEMQVKKGRGYVTAEENVAEDLEIGTIPVPPANMSENDLEQLVQTITDQIMAAAS
jgi:hypothetical protein